MINVSRSLASEPFLISALVRMACDQIAVQRVERTLGLCLPKSRLLESQRVLQQEADSDLIWYCVRGERSGLNHLFTNLGAGVISFKQIGGSNSISRSNGEDLLVPFGEWWFRPHLANDHALSMELMTEIYEVRQLPEHQQRRALNHAIHKIKDLPQMHPDCLLTRLIFPAVNKIFDASLRAKANLRCAATGIAVERFRLARGRWPDSLDEIPRSLLSAIPLDPFDGKPLKYVQRADGVTIYSIGLDEQDDGGTIPIGKATNQPGQDVGFRLYNPDQRGLPTLPRSSMPGNFAIGSNGEEILTDDDVPEIGPRPREVGGR